ncbi:MAG: EF-hand domain-containing protein [Pseudomonadota bacterium]
MNRILLGATVLALAVPAMAQVQAPAAPPVMPRGEIAQTRDQAVAKVREHFARMDANRDGFVATDEMRSMRGQQMGERRGGGERRAMRNRAANPAAAFDRLDSNRDGMISREEFGQAREIRMERQAGRKMNRMGGKGGGRMMRLADLDRDGRVSLQEATTSALQRFDRVDANRDGRITPDERKQQREQRRALRAQRAG